VCSAPDAGGSARESASPLNSADKTNVASLQTATEFCPFHHFGAFGVGGSPCKSGSPLVIRGVIAKSPELPKIETNTLNENGEEQRKQFQFRCNLLK
jgi:hypothetical protein